MGTSTTSPVGPATVPFMPIICITCVHDPRAPELTIAYTVPSGSSVCCTKRPISSRASSHTSTVMR